MSVEVYNDYMVCSDLVLERNGEALYEERYAEIVSGVERLQALCPGGSLVTGDSDEDNEFSSRPCDCCEQPRAAGSRHKATLLCTKSAGVDGLKGLGASIMRGLGFWRG